MVSITNTYIQDRPLYSGKQTSCFQLTVLFLIFFLKDREGKKSRVVKC
jgi:hypothetical protein